MHFFPCLCMCYMASIRILMQVFEVHDRRVHGPADSGARSWLSQSVLGLWNYSWYVPRPHTMTLLRSCRMVWLCLLLLHAVRSTAPACIHTITLCKLLAKHELLQFSVKRLKGTLCWCVLGHCRPPCIYNRLLCIQCRLPFNQLTLPFLSAFVFMPNPAAKVQPLAAAAADA